MLGLGLGEGVAGAVGWLAVILGVLRLEPNFVLLRLEIALNLGSVAGTGAGSGALGLGRGLGWGWSWGAGGG